MGDYHYAALTSTGKLLTWGQYSAGALGLGDPTKLRVGTPGAYANERDKTMARLSPPSVDAPTEVKFGTKDYARGRNVFAFGVTACGWHTGTLVIDLDVCFLYREGSCPAFFIDMFIQLGSGIRGAR